MGRPEGRIRNAGILKGGTMNRKCFHTFTMMSGKPVYVRGKHVTGVFENKYGDKIVTVINLVSGGRYTVKERAEEVIAELTKNGKGGE